MSAQIHFVDSQLSLVHIPLEQYHRYLQSILKLLFPSPIDYNETGDPDEHEWTSWANRHPFLNVSITPIECSIVCSKQLAQQYLAPTLKALFEKTNKGYDQASVSDDDFVVISVEGEGLEAGQRVLELTSPLALAGISIFFITTYFSDYILVPSKSRSHVVRALEDRGFTFQKSSDVYVNPLAHHHRSKSSTSSIASPLSPFSPPTTLSDLQNRTFNLLNKHHIHPRVDPSIRLVSCAARRDDPNSAAADELTLQLGLTKCLIHSPKFLSLTLTQDEPASLLLERASVGNFGDALLGSKDEFLVPITLDLGELPFEATGIVCGVAGRLCGGGGDVDDDEEGVAEEMDGNNKIEMSYLSTTRAGTVMVNEADLERAMGLLRVNGGC
ncbi:MAG: hypothetical protein HETSPECPRED_005190 [Heterodermia speciosa]|uniref:CASTOR ACT domain-containing protein n=1 Tax=Heterodermia speciosa TaxID=116794 RepID=A0A8H3FED9_9LECA|nr:MAG: hypothetical protein HETSPECPRED_005190 [Heterodermia speciosa]